jgi:hypothetical protein
MHVALCQIAVDGAQYNYGLDHWYVASSCLKQTSESSAEVLELPVRRWTQDYKEFLEAMVRPEDKAEVMCLLRLVEKAVKCGWGRSARAGMPLCLPPPPFPGQASDHSTASILACVNACTTAASVLGTTAPVWRLLQAPALIEYKEHHTDVNVRFCLKFLPGKIDELRGTAGGIEAKLKLVTKFSTSARTSCAELCQGGGGSTKKMSLAMDLHCGHPNM